MSSLTSSSLELRLKREAKNQAYLYKLGRQIGQLIEIAPLSKIFQVWKNWRKGIYHAALRRRTTLGDGVHGVTHLNRGRVSGIEVSTADSQRRQLITAVHELLHGYAGSQQPPHDQLHTMAVVLSESVFPQAEGNQDMLFDRDELEVLSDLQQRRNMIANSELDAEDDEEEMDESVVVNDGDMSEALAELGLQDGDSIYDLYSRRKKKRGFLGMGRGKRVKKKRDSGLAGDATVVSWGGWIMPQIKKAYESQSLLLPFRGIYRATPTFNFAGYKAPSFGAFWSQLIQSLDSGANRTVKGFAKATAAVGLPTVVTLAPALTRSIGLLVRITGSLTELKNEPVLVNHFSGVGQVSAPYIVGIEFERGAAEYLILHVENDRGSGVPTAIPDAQLTIAADAIAAGTVVAIESINYRELEA